MRTFLSFFAIAAIGFGRQDPVVCGTHDAKTLEELALHRSARELPRQDAVVRRTPMPDVGNIAIVSAEDGVVARRNPFNLNARTLRFSPEGPGYRLEIAESSYDVEAAGAGSIVQGIGDDDSRRIAFPFEFSFFGQQWASAYVNSDGNLTFGQGEAGTTERSLGRLHGGPPRIAALFRDMDPSQPGGAIRVLAEPTRVVISWAGVREYSDFGNGTRQTFQIRLYPNGRIEIAYGEVQTSSAVVGITPGRSRGAPQFVSLVSAPAGPYDSTVAERFTNNEEIDVFTAAQRFYESHEDAYDYLVIFNSGGIAAGQSALAYEVTIRNPNTAGIGDLPIDLGLEAGSPRRLRAILNLGMLNDYPADPNAPVPSRGVTGDTPLTVLGHEAGHLWLALASIREGDSLPLLGRGLSHWSFNFNSEASLLEGNRIEDRGPDVTPRFRTVATVQGYSPLDRYLMGLLPPEQVGPMFYVSNANTQSARAPQVGIGINGTRRDFTVDELIAAEGRRIPDYTVSQRTYRFAFIVVSPDSEPVPQDALAKVETFRREFTSFFARAAADQAKAETVFRRSIALSAFPAAGVLIGRSTPVTIRLSRSTSTPLTIRLQQRYGLLDIPRQVTIPAGASSAAFSARGLGNGVELIYVKASSSLYETVVARMQVAMPEDTRLVSLPASELDPAVVRVRLTDINLLPYAGVKIEGSTATGVLQPVSDVTDENGQAAFRYDGPAGAELRFRTDTGATLTIVTGSQSDAASAN